MKCNPCQHRLPSTVPSAVAIVLTLTLGMGGAQAAEPIYCPTPYPASCTIDADGFIKLVAFPQDPGDVAPDTWTVARILTDSEDVENLKFRVKALGEMAVIETEGATGFIPMATQYISALVVASPSVAPGHTVIEIVISYDDNYSFGLDPDDWVLEVEQLSPDRSYTGYLETGVGDRDAIAALVQLPRMEILTPEIAFAEVHLGAAADDAPYMPVPIKNLGTATLEIALQPNPISGADEDSFEREVKGLGSILPGGELENDWAGDTGLWVTCAPENFGPNAATLTVESTGGTQDVGLTATGVSLYSVLLLDVSGSMQCNPAGSQCSSVPETDTRLWKMKQAAKQMTLLIDQFSNSRAYIGLSSFPYPGDADICKADSVDEGCVAVNVDQIEFNKDTIYGGLGDAGDTGALTARNNTPMSSGFHAATGNMANRLGPLGLDPGVLRQAILLLSDGDANEDHSDPPHTAWDWVDELLGLGIKVYAVGYEDEDSNWVNWGLLTALGAEGAVLPADTDDAFALANAFKDAARAWLGLRTVEDPPGLINAGQTLEYTVSLDETSYGVTFVVDWEYVVEGGIELEVKPPNGPWITPSSADVTYEKGKTFAMYVIRGERMRGGQGAGEWTLRLKAKSELPAEPMAFFYSVYAQSPISLEPAMSMQQMVTGETPLLTADLQRLPAAARRHTTVTAAADYPAASLKTHVAVNYLDPDRLVRRARGPATATAGPGDYIPEILRGEPATLVQRKLYGLALAGKPFPGERAEQQIRLYDDGSHGDKVAGDGVFSAHVPALDHDGVHRFRLRSVTKQPGEAEIHREASLAGYVDIGLDGRRLGRQIRWRKVEITPFFGEELEELLRTPPAKGRIRRAVVVTPRDAGGNYFGPGEARDFVFGLSGAEPVGPVVDNLDGTYLQVVEFHGRVKPEVEVAAGEVASSLFRLGSRSWQLGAYLGSSWPGGDADDSFDAEYSAALAAGYRFDEHWSLDLITGYHSFTADRGGDDPSLFQLSINGRYSWPLNRSEIFARGGPGFYDPQGGGSELGWNLGVGWSIPYRVGWDLEITIDHHQAGSGEDEFQTAQVGLRKTLP